MSDLLLFWIVWAVVIGFLFYVFWVRNYYVYEARMRVLEKIFKQLPNGNFFYTHEKINDLMSKWHKYTSYDKMMFSLLTKPSTITNKFITENNLYG